MSIDQAAIRDCVVPTLRPYARRIVLFGSMARGDMRPDSDIDLLITLRSAGARPVLGLKWFELEEVLSRQLGRSVEMVTEAALSAHVRPFVEQDSIVLYEE